MLTGREFVDMMSDHICREVQQDIHPTGDISPKSLRILAALRTQERVQHFPIASEEQKVLLHRYIRAAVCGKLEQEYGSPFLQ